MKTLLRYIYFSFLFCISIFSGIFYYNCAATQWVDVVKNFDDSDPKWDTSVIIPVLSKTVELRDNLTEGVSIDPYVPDPVTPITMWPVPIDISMDLSGNIPLECTIDFDNNTVNDMDLRGLYSQNITIDFQVWLTDAAETICEIQPSDVVFSPITIEGITYNFQSPPTNVNNVLHYTLDDFLSESHDYYMDFGGDPAGNYDQIDFENFIIYLLSGAAVHSSNAPYTLNIQVVIDVGDDFGVAGLIENEAILISAEDESIPIDQIPMSSAEGFAFNFNFESVLSSDILMGMEFDGDTQPVPNTHDVNINSGVLETNNINNYEYTISTCETLDEFEFQGNVTDYGNLTMDYQITLPSNSDVILLKTSDYVIVDINIVLGKITIEF